MRTLNPSSKSIHKAKAPRATGPQEKRKRNRKKRFSEEGPISAEAAARIYLGKVLKQHGKVRYSRFYNDKPNWHKNLLRAMGLREADCESPQCTIDEVVVQLEQAGLVATSETDETLVDGSPDYEIRLTEKGQAILDEGSEFYFEKAYDSRVDAPFLPWRPTKDDRSDEESDARKIISNLDIKCRKIENEQSGIVELGLGSIILVFEKRPPGLDDPDNVLPPRVLASVQKGLAEVGAEEICHLLFCGGYLLLVKPVDLPLYDATTRVCMDQASNEFFDFREVIQSLGLLAYEASEAVYRRTGTLPVG